MADQPTLPPLRDVITRHNLSASKALGQNFLFDEQLLARIVAIPGDLEGEKVLEIGPGPGGLTRALLRAGAEVTAIERDRRCIAPLSELADAYGGKLRVVEGDAMAIDHAELMGGPCHIAANLPYNVGTALLVQWLIAREWPPYWKSLTLMFQREVADRIVAEPGTGAFGRLSVLAQWRSEAKLAMKVHRSAFTPPPKVMSAVVHIVPTPAPDGVDAQLLGRVTEAAFGQRRKMLRQSLKGLPGALAALGKAGIDPQRRPEQLSVGEFIELARHIGGQVA